MTTFIKTKFKNLDDHTNIDKYKEAANNTEYHIIFYPRTILSFEKQIAYFIFIIISNLVT